MQVIDWHISLETVWCISSLCIKFPRIINSNILQVVPGIREKVSLYLMCISKDDKTKFIPNPFLWSICNDFYAFIQAFVTKHVTLFKNVFMIEESWVW